MFDLFGLKARRRAAELEEIVCEQSQAIADMQITRIQQGCEVARLKEHLSVVRKMADKMRDRVRSHGMTEAEREFLDVCLDIHAAGKAIAPPRFKVNMEKVRKQRESLKDWGGK